VSATSGGEAITSGEKSMQRQQPPEKPGARPQPETLDGLLSELSVAMLHEQMRAVPTLASLTPHHLRLLSWVDDHPAASWHAVRRALGCPPIQTGQLVKDLVRLRLLECGVLWPRQRAITLRLAAPGRVLLRRLEAEQRALCARLLAGLTPAEQAALARGLSALARAAA
jgi:DNA-binding MarR family transcriptional regulator